MIKKWIKPRIPLFLLLGISIIGVIGLQDLGFLLMIAIILPFLIFWERI